jgi:hypothetical protein
MRTMRRLLLLRGLVTVVAAVASVIFFASGETLLGALLAGLVITNIVLITVFVRAQRSQSSGEVQA